MLEIVKKLVLMLLMIATVSCADNIFEELNNGPQPDYEGDVELHLAGVSGVFLDHYVIAGICCGVTVDLCA